MCSTGCGTVGSLPWRAVSCASAPLSARRRGRAPAAGARARGRPARYHGQRARAARARHGRGSFGGCRGRIPPSPGRAIRRRRSRQVSEPPRPPRKAPCWGGSRSRAGREFQKGTSALAGRAATNPRAANSGTTAWPLARGAGRYNGRERRMFPARGRADFAKTPVPDSVEKAASAVRAEYRLEGRCLRSGTTPWFGPPLGEIFADRRQHREGAVPALSEVHGIRVGGAQAIDEIGRAHV